MRVRVNEEIIGKSNEGDIGKCRICYRKIQSRRYNLRDSDRFATTEWLNINSHRVDTVGVGYR